jgi:hypothetical protein
VFDFRNKVPGCSVTSGRDAESDIRHMSLSLKGFEEPPLGVGLVQLTKVPEYARRLGNYFSNCLGNAACSPAMGDCPELR